MKPISSDLNALNLSQLSELAYAASDSGEEFRTRVASVTKNSQLSTDDKKKAITLFINEKSDNNPCTEIIIECILGSCELY